MCRLSVIIITRNEADNIRDCLASVAWAAEIIVMDSGSTDATVAICREFTPHVYLTDWPGFGPQKNRCLAKASHDWVLSLDADERVSPELRQAIEAAMTQTRYAAWRMPRRSWFCGKFMRHSGWWPDYVVRLFQRGQAQFSNDLVHERLLVEGAVGTLSTPLIHYSFRDLDMVLNKMNSYSTLGAQRLQHNGKQGSLRQAILHGIWTFIRCYIVRLGFLDGKHGLILAINQAEGTYYRYLKAMFLAESQR